MIELASIAGLVDKKNMALLSDYLMYLKLGEQHFTDSASNKDLRLKQLQLLEKALRKEFKLKKNLLSRLQQIFLAENLSVALLLDVLQGWRYSVQADITQEKSFSEICGYVLSPLARLLMVLKNENPSTYLPMSSLLVCLYWLDLMKLRAPLISKVKSSKRNKINKMNGLIKNSKVILQLVSSPKLKFQLAVLLNTTQIKILKIAENKQPHIGILDGFKIFLYSSLQFLSVKKRTVCQKGI